MKHFVEFTNPFTLLVSDKEMDDMKLKLKQFEEGTLPDSVSDEELWKAKNVVSNTYARDGSKIPWPFRMSGYALGNLPITVGLILPNASLPTMIFWQWANQTQNALTNHYNRSGAESVSTQKIMESYFGAVGAAVAIAIGSKLAVRRVASESLRNTLGKIIPFFAVASANVLNTYLMRRHETVTGIPVTDNGQVVGISKKAAEYAIGATCLSRVIMSFCMVAVPPFIYPVFERSHVIKTKPLANLAMQFAVVTVLIFTVIPFSVGFFSQELDISSSKLEPEFSQKYPNKNLTFNKGL
eukprot:TRINITY_DN8713_c0_g1_i1.p1 TRINITY_DN8713_c0_g1~~TRINITY_DN8713_c0_g1_i1.p1  ORF type:complete len:328 (-),score=62.64 TRINITY_DN8713_c0_g1_i1:119-1009(-)